MVHLSNTVLGLRLISLHEYWFSCPNINLDVWATHSEGTCCMLSLNLKAKGFLIPLFIPHVSVFIKPKTSTLLQPTCCSWIPRIHCWLIKDTIYVLVYPSLLLSWFSELGGWRGWGWGVFHVPVFRCLLFFSIWSRSLGQQTGDSIRCFEVVRSVLSLHFLFSLPVSPPAFVSLIRKVPGHV